MAQIQGTMPDGSMQSFNSPQEMLAAYQAGMARLNSAPAPTPGNATGSPGLSNVLAQPAQSLTSNMRYNPDQGVNFSDNPARGYTQPIGTTGAPAPTQVGQMNLAAPPSPQQINWGDAAHGPNAGPTSLPDILRSLINQSQQQTGYGQNALLQALGQMGGFGGQVGGQFNQALGTSNQIMNQLPSSLNWAGGQAVGAAGQQNQMLQQLFGQGAGLTQGMGTGARDMMNAIGGRITDPLQQLMNQGWAQNQNPGASQGPGLANRAEAMLNASGAQLNPTLLSLLGGQNPTLQAGMGMFGRGLDPATQAAMQTQATDQTAQQYNNAHQQMMTQLLAQGALGGGADMPGAGMAQMVQGLGGLDIAQQQQQAQLQQQGILANQQAMEQNRQLALGAAGTSMGGQLGALGQGFGAAQGFTGLEQNAADVAQQMGLGAAQTMGGLGSQFTNTLQQALESNRQLGLGGAQMLGQQSLGFTGQTGNMYGLGMQYPQAYMGAMGQNLQSILGGTQALGQMGQQGTQGLSALTGPFASIQGGNSGILGALLGAAGTALAGPLGGTLAGMIPTGGH